MMSIDKKTGIMTKPVGRCYKGEGMCLLRERADSTFECVYNAAGCRYRRIVLGMQSEKDDNNGS